MAKKMKTIPSILTNTPTLASVAVYVKNAHKYLIKRKLSLKLGMTHHKLMVNNKNFLTS